MPQLFVSCDLVARRGRDQLFRDVQHWFDHRCGALSSPVGVLSAAEIRCNRKLLGKTRAARGSAFAFVAQFRTASGVAKSSRRGESEEPMTRRLSQILLVSLALVIASAGGARASTILVANLSNSQENPPTNPTLSGGGPRPASFGTATFFLNDAMTSLTFAATIFNIDVTGSQTADVNDNLIAAHIHASATVTPTTNAGVVWGFFGAPFNDNSPNDFVFTPFATGVGGTFSGKWDLTEGNGTTLTAQLPNILSGHSYINFHTTQFGGGEIRGNISVVTPEPGTILLLGTGTVGLIRRHWRRQRR